MLVRRSASSEGRRCAIKQSVCGSTGETTLSPGELFVEATLPAWAMNRPFRPLPGLAPGDSLDQRWRCLGYLAAGGEGIVYLVGGNGWEGLRLAAKLSPGALTRERKKRLRRLQKEAQPHSHHALMPLLDYGSLKLDGEEVTFEIFPFYAGGSLEGCRLREEDLPGRVLVPLLQALEALHGRNLVHNDIKPSNLFWSAAEGSVLLGDYGCLGDVASRQNTGGSPAFMAPEVLLGQARSPAADYCALGLTLLALLSGSSPLAGLQPRACINRWNLGLELPSVSPDMIQLLEGLLCRDPSRRTTAEGLRDWLRTHGIVPPSPAWRKEKKEKSTEIPLLFFGEGVVGNEDELLEAAAENWSLALHLFQQDQIQLFLRKLNELPPNPDFPQRVHYPELLARVENHRENASQDAALFFLLANLSPRSARIVWKGRVYEGLEALARSGLERGAGVELDEVSFCRDGPLEIYRALHFPEDTDRRRFCERLQMQARFKPRFALEMLAQTGGERRKPVFIWQGQKFYTLEQLATWLLEAPNWDAAVGSLLAASELESWLALIGHGKLLNALRTMQFACSSAGKRL